MLKIENFKPVYIYKPEKEMSRTLKTPEIDISLLANKIREALDLENLAEVDEDIFSIFEQSSLGDERLVEEIPNDRINDPDFDIEGYILEKVEELINEDSEYDDIDMTEEVRTEVNKNRNTDILATSLEILINILIASTLKHAGDFGIGHIELQDESGMHRLKEKMASELSKMDIEIILD